MNGLKTSLEQEYPHIHLQDVIEMTGNDIKDYQLTRKALEAFQEMGYFKSSRIICYDSSAEIEKELRNRNITATIIQQPQLQGYTAVRTLFEYLSSGKSPASKNQFIQTRIILKENLSEI